VDSVWFSGTDWGRWSECGDIDGDGIDECIWTTPFLITVYKAVGKDSLQRVWNWCGLPFGIDPFVPLKTDPPP